MDESRRASSANSDNTRKTQNLSGIQWSFEIFWSFVVVTIIFLFQCLRHPDETYKIGLGFGGLAMMALCTIKIREEHAGHVYTLWYLFWLTSCCALLIYYYMDRLDILDFSQIGMMARLPKDAPFWQRALRWYLLASTDIQGEIELLLLIVGVITVPQVLSFLVSGLFGCGAQPVLIAKSVHFALLCLIKFFCVLSALIFAQFAILLVYPWTSYSNQILEATRAIESCFFWLGFAFNLSVIYFYPANNPYIGLTIGSKSCLRAMWGYMTRYTKR